VLYNTELVRYLDRDYVSDTLEKRAWRSAEAIIAGAADIQVSIVPNPASDAVSVCVNTFAAMPIGFTTTITSLIGTTVFSHYGIITQEGQECITAATSHLARGVYMVRGESMNHSVVTMLVLH